MCEDRKVFAESLLDFVGEKLIQWGYGELHMKRAVSTGLRATDLCLGTILLGMTSCGFTIGGDPGKPIYVAGVVSDVAVTSPAPGTFINARNAGFFELQGTCSFPGGPILYQGKRDKVATCQPDKTWSLTLDLSEKSDGMVKLDFVHVQAGVVREPDQEQAGSVAGALADSSAAASEESHQNDRPIFLATAEAQYPKDTVDPVVLVEPLAAPINKSMENGLISVSGRCSEPGRAVQGSVRLKQAGVPRMLFAQDPLCEFSGSWRAEVDASSFPEGDFEMHATQRDDAGNLGRSDDVDGLKDTIVPVVQITEPADNAIRVVGGSYRVSGQCSENDVDVNLSSGGVSLGETPCQSGSFQMDVFQSIPAARMLRAEQVDRGDNRGNHQRRVRDVRSGDQSFDVVSRTEKNPIDMLFVIDTSGSMGQAPVGMKTEHQILSEATAPFIEGFTSGRRLDFQIGVTLTDIHSEANRTNKNVNTDPSLPFSPSPFTPGALVARQGNPHILKPNFAIPSSPDYTDAKNQFRLNAFPGVHSQHGNEAGILGAIRSMDSALNAVGARNNGFYRKDADLAVVIVTDEDNNKSANGAGATVDKAKCEAEALSLYNAIRQDHVRGPNYDFKNKFSLIGVLNQADKGCYQYVLDYFKNNNYAARTDNIDINYRKVVAGQPDENFGNLLVNLGKAMADVVDTKTIELPYSPEPGTLEVYARKAGVRVRLALNTDYRFNAADRKVTFLDPQKSLEIGLANIEVEYLTLMPEL